MLRIDIRYAYDIVDVTRRIFRVRLFARSSSPCCPISGFVSRFESLLPHVQSCLTFGEMRLLILH
jgi:hypothetical protein